MKGAFDTAILFDMASLVTRPNNPVYYIQFHVAGSTRRVRTDTDNLQLAKEKLRQSESAQARGEISPLPTRTPVADVVSKYVKYIRA